ncbi:MAG: hypothetical protein DRH32_07195 [Deltaproteobacteria bacterium]|nr:MAG: hypothetical protein DRH32_07195 [Deltaproteobacteria bacterium]
MIAKRFIRILLYCPVGFLCSLYCFKKSKIGSGHENKAYLVPERKPLISPISALGSNFNPQNTKCIPPVKIFARLELEKIFRFSFRH